LNIVGFGLLQTFDMFKSASS